jgi:hypothetical protein
LVNKKKTMSQVYASLTTIPSRVNRTLNATIESLESQTYPLAGIIVTMPTVNMRGQSWDNKVDLTFLDKRMGVVCHRPEYDLGPVMKYIGCLDYTPPDALIYVCDDDQQYATDRVSNLVNTWNELNDANAIIGWTGRGMQSLFTQSRSIYGFRGVLVPRSAIVKLKQYLDQSDILKPCCAMNDDVLASIIFTKSGYHITNRSGQDDEFQNEVNHEHVDALHSQYKSDSAKYGDMIKCHWQHNQPFMGLVLAGIITSIVAFIGLLTAFILFIKGA